MPLTDRILDAAGRPTRATRRALVTVTLATFFLAFVVTAGTSAPDTEPAPVLRDDPPVSAGPASARLRTAAPLPDLRRERPRLPAVAPAREPAEPAIPAQATPTATPAPVAPAPATTPPAPPPPAAAPAPAPPAPPQPAPEPEPSFDSSGEFDSSG